MMRKKDTVSLYTECRALLLRSTSPGNKRVICCVCRPACSITLTRIVRSRRGSFHMTGWRHLRTSCTRIARPVMTSFEVSSTAILTHDGLAVLRGLLCLRIVNVVVIQDFAVHHDLPCVDWEICIVERPVEFLFCHGLIRWIMVRRKIFMSKPLTSRDSFSRVKDQHLFQEINC